MNLARWRAIHTYSSAIVLLQLLLWIVSGIGFSVVSEKDLRGELESRNAPRAAIPFGEMGDVLDRLPSCLRGRVPEPMRVLQVETLMAPRTGGPVHRVTVEGLGTPVVIDARSGEVLEPLTADEARRIAREDFTGDGTDTSVEWITEPLGKGYDYFGPVPVYRVNFSNWKRTRLYVSPLTGEILARRNVHKTLFDFWWTVHVFGYVDKNIPWNVPIIVFGALTLVAFVSGLPLFLPWLRRWRLGHASRAVAQPIGNGEGAIGLDLTSMKRESNP